MKGGAVIFELLDSHADAVERLDEREDFYRFMDAGFPLWAWSAAEPIEMNCHRGFRFSEGRLGSRKESCGRRVWGLRTTRLPFGVLLVSGVAGVVIPGAVAGMFLIFPGSLDFESCA